MPVVKVCKETLLESICHRNFTDEEFNDLCFDFGLELDDVVMEDDGKVYYCIDVSANRFDLFCMEGLSIALNAYCHSLYVDVSNISISSDVVIEQYKVFEREFVSACLIKDIEEFSLESFTEYLERLNQTLGRNRSLVCIDAHDLDSVTENCTGTTRISYKYKNLNDVLIRLQNSTDDVRVSTLEDFYKDDKKTLKHFNLLSSKNSSVVFENIDCKTVLSVPPLVCSDKTKLSKNSKNVFITVSGTNKNKIEQALKLVVNAFRGETVEIVGVNKVNDAEKTTSQQNTQFLDLTDSFKTEISYSQIIRKLKLSISADEMSSILKRMMYTVTTVHGEQDLLSITASPARIDIISDCDVYEDIAVGFRFRNIPRTLPTFVSFGAENRLNEFTNKVRNEFALCGYNELLTLTLLSKDEAFSDSVCLSNYKSKDCEAVRSSLIQGVLKSICYNKHHKLPIKVFEISDVVKIESAEESFLPRNVRCFVGAMASSANSVNLEELQGCLSHVLKKCHNAFNIVYESHLPRNTVNEVTAHSSLSLELKSLFIKEQSAEIFINNVSVGIIGIFNPNYSYKVYSISYPLAGFEVNLEKVFQMLF